MANAMGACLAFGIGLSFGLLAPALLQMFWSVQLYQHCK
jgi:hypothetical protein